jgi:hypothetical protein
MKLITWILGILLTGCGGTGTMNYSFLDHAILDKNKQGQLVDVLGQPFTVWQRTVTGPRSSTIDWVNSRELFYWDDSWVYLDRFINNLDQQEYQQWVTHQEFCQQGVCSVISQEGKQKYAPVNITGNYNLNTVGYIMTPQGQRINFRHDQEITVGVACSNPYYNNQKCIIQQEQWWDNNQSEFQLKIDRKTWYALGLGPGFIIESKFPDQWTAYLK